MKKNIKKLEKGETIEFEEKSDEESESEEESEEESSEEEKKGKEREEREEEEERRWEGEERRLGEERVLEEERGREERQEGEERREEEEEELIEIISGGPSTSSIFLPKYQKSLYILAKFASEDNSIDIYPDQIQFFFVHEISTNRINMENHYLAYVRWYKKIKNRFYFDINQEQICNVELWAYRLIIKID
ncbi:hypothetical protein Glove_293g23 [Diversispora epigaea]|uniref:Uncharacterized protein n=1 Tax=Diversispora epigaea TaxID=1348612 RepID=A0A397HZR6_9GLOM|nr:hypothetical protein Glove_293g23 [Diversispora epigaea]